MCFSSLQEWQLHNEKQKEKRKDLKCTHRLWCLEMNKCLHKSVCLLFDSHFPCSFSQPLSFLPSFGVSAVIYVEVTWVTYSLWGWQWWSQVPIVFIPNFHFRMQAIPSPTWLKINLKKWDVMSRRNGDPGRERREGNEVNRCGKAVPCFV